MTTRYTKDHEWIRLDGDVATVGITDHAQIAARRRRLCRAARDRPQGREGRRGRGGRVGQGGERRLRAGEPARWSRSTTRSTARPATVNEDAEGKGWFLKLKLGARALDELMTAEQYKEFLGTLE